MNSLSKNYRADLPGRFSEIDLLDKHWSRIVNMFNDIVLPPYEVLIQPSSRCNLSCKWCIGSFVVNKSQSTLLPTKLDSVDAMKRVVESIADYKKVAPDYERGGKSEFCVENVSFSGITGEPLIAKEATLYAMDFLSKRGIRVGMFTNGTLITEDTHEVLLNTAYVLVSVDAGDDNTYSVLKCNNANKKMFSQVLNNIEKLVKKKLKTNSNLDINIGFVVNQHNYNQILPLAKKIKDIGVHYFRIKTDISSHMLLNKEQISESKEQIDQIIRDLCDEKFELVQIHHLGDERQKQRCYGKCFANRLIGAVASDGNLYPCNYHPKPGGHTYGNAIDHSFQDIWDGVEKKEMDKIIPSICPSVCDPFKNRSNMLLNELFDIYSSEGVDALRHCRDNIKRNHSRPTISNSLFSNRTYN